MLKLRSYYLLTALGLALFFINVLTFVSVNHTRVARRDRSEDQLSTEKRRLVWPSFMDNFPDLLNVSSDEIQPLLLTTRGRARKQIAIAIPVAQRSKDYTLDTLSSLFNGTGVRDRNDVVFIVMLAYNVERINSVLDKSTEIMNRFPREVATGLLEVIAVPTAWYQIDIANIPPTLNDSSSRMYWRTKQNIDYIYLMTYGCQRANFYLQMEDDVEATPEYMRVITNYIKFKDKAPWFLIEFSELGFIGKLFKCVDVKAVTSTIALYYRFKPVDWILDDMLRSRYCALGEPHEKCLEEIAKWRVRSSSPQFQHIGNVSSLTGKIQQLREGAFGTGKSKGHRGNPPAVVYTSMAAYDIHNAQLGYNTNVAMCFMSAVKGDFLHIHFLSPVNVTGLMLLSGVAPAPSGKLGPETIVHGYDIHNREIRLGTFSKEGDFVLRMNGTLLLSVRLFVTAAIRHRIAIDHIFVERASI